MTIKRNVLATSYEIPISMEMYDSINYRDKGDWLRSQETLCPKKLYEVLNSLEGISDADYNGHFGLFIFLTVEAKHDNESMWSKIETVITDYCR